jgi:hypothetical protein
MTRPEHRTVCKATKNRATQDDIEAGKQSKLNLELLFSTTKTADPSPREICQLPEIVNL